MQRFVKTYQSIKNFFAIPSQAKNAGFSIIEVIIVLALIGTIMGILVSTIARKKDEADRQATMLAMGSLQQELTMYRVDNAGYPTSDQGLRALVTNPTGSSKWRGPYVEESRIKDTWDQEYQYESDGRQVKMTSAGPDRSFGTEDDIKYPEEQDAPKS